MGMKVAGMFLPLKTYTQRRFDEMNADDTSSPLSARGQSPSPFCPTKRAPASRTQDHVTHTKKPVLWKMAPTIIPRPDKFSKPLKPNPFHSGLKEMSPTVANISLDPPRRNLFQSDWNLDHLKEKRKKPESLLPFKVDSRGKPLVPVALGSRQRMTSKS
jgi:hypothetical protein